MARLPTVEDFGRRPGISPDTSIATVDAGYIARGVKKLGAGLASLGEDIGQRAQIDQERAFRDQESAAKGTWGVSVADIDAKADSLTNPDEIDKMAPEYEAALGRAAAGIADPRRRQMFVDERLPQVAVRRAGLGKISRKYRDDTTLAQVDGDLDTLMQKAVSTTDPDLKDELAASARGLVEGLQSRGIISAVEGGKRLRQWMQGYLESDLEVRARQALAEGDTAGARMIQAEAGGASTGDRYMVAKKPPGLVERGNIDLYSRPRARNADGSVSTVRSISIGEDGREVLIPTVSPDGRVLSDEEAVEQYRKTGQNLGKFSSVHDAESYADTLHKQQDGLTRRPRISSRIISVESGGDPTAKNPSSSATGAGQFLDGTWLDVVKRHRPDIVKGKTEAQILDLRNDPVLSAEMVDAHSNDNAVYLQSKGLPATDGNVYLAFFAGAGGAEKLLKADPDAPAESVLGSKAVEANEKVLRGKTAGEVIDWAARKMGDNPMQLSAMRGIAVYDRIGNLIDDHERQQIAADNDAAKARKVAYDRQYNDLQLGIMDGKAGATDIQDAREAGWLTDADDIGKLQQELRARDKDSLLLSNAIRAAADPNYSFDPLNPEDRNAVGALAKANRFGDRLAAGDQSAVPEVRALVDRTGIVPREVKGTLGAMVRSDDPQRFTFAMSTLDQLQKQAPAVFAKEFDDGTTKQLATWQTLLPYKSKEEILKTIRGETDPTMMKIREQRTSEAKKLGAKITVDDVLDVFDPGWMVPGPDVAPSINPRVDGGRADALRTEYEALFSDRYAALGDEKAAREAAGRMILNGWGPSVTSGGNVIRRPPDSYYPKVDGSHDWMVGQLDTAIEKATGLGPYPTRKDDVRAGEGFRRWELVPTDETDADIARGVPPRYLVTVRYDDGRYGLLLDAKGMPREWRFDPSEFQKQGRRQFNEARDFYSTPGALELEPLRGVRSEAGANGDEDLLPAEAQANAGASPLGVPEVEVPAELTDRMNNPGGDMEVMETWTEWERVVDKFITDRNLKPGDRFRTPPPDGKIYEYLGPNSTGRKDWAPVGDPELVS